MRLKSAREAVYLSSSAHRKVRYQGRRDGLPQHQERPRVTRPRVTRPRARQRSVGHALCSANRLRRGKKEMIEMEEGG
eukprot:1377890-Pleurochrysis_carterae.AAC.2